MPFLFISTATIHTHHACKQDTHLSPASLFTPFSGRRTQNLPGKRGPCASLCLPPPLLWASIRFDHLACARTILRFRLSPPRHLRGAHTPIRPSAQNSRSVHLITKSLLPSVNEPMMLWSPRSAGTGGGDGEGDSESFSSRGPTQVEDDFLESYEEKTLMGEASQLSQQEASSNSNGNGAAKDRPPEPWGRLLPLKRGAAHIKLFPRPAETSNGQANTYIFGRGHSCDIRLEDARISSQHCRIYCLENREPGGRITFKVYVEDTSSNGTFVNRRVRLAKSQRRLLNSGDELCLVKARDDQDYEAASYVFIPMEPHQPQARRPLNSGAGGEISYPSLATAFASSVATAAAPAAGGGMSSVQPPPPPPPPPTPPRQLLQP